MLLALSESGEVNHDWVKYGDNCASSCNAAVFHNYTCLTPDE